MRDTIQAAIADMHVGSQHSVCADRFWNGLNNNTHSPNTDQLYAISRFYNFADALAKFREGRSLKLFLMGDMVEGVLLGTNEVWTNNPMEMSNVAIELLVDFKKRAKWRAGDLLYCLRGTYRHSEDWEEKIGEELGAEVGVNGKYSQDQWTVETNGKITWSIHQWVTAGVGANEGNPIYNGLKNLYISSLKDLTRHPDNVYGAHFHRFGHSVYSWRSGTEVGVMQGTICPPFKGKDRFAAKVSKFEKNFIGGMMQLVTAGGVIDVPKFV